MFLAFRFCPPRRAVHKFNHISHHSQTHNHNHNHNQQSKQSSAITSHISLGAIVINKGRAGRKKQKSTTI
jgi:hypothetical protein